MKTKQIAWSYATSTNAKRFGFGATGCYTVEYVNLDADMARFPTEALAGFATKVEAISFAADLVEPYNSYSL